MAAAADAADVDGAAAEDVGVCVDAEEVVAIDDADAGTA